MSTRKNKAKIAVAFMKAFGWAFTGPLGNTKGSLL